MNNRKSTLENFKFHGILGQYFVNPSNFQTLSISGLTPNVNSVIADDPANYCVTSETVVVLLARKDLELDNFTGKSTIGLRLFQKLAKLACSLSTSNWEECFETAKTMLVKTGRIEGFEALDVKHGNLIWISTITVENLINEGYLRYE